MREEELIRMLGMILLSLTAFIIVAISVIIYLSNRKYVRDRSKAVKRAIKEFNENKK